MAEARFNELLRAGLLYRHSDLKTAAAGEQFYVVVRAGPTKNLIVERLAVSSNGQEFELGAFVAEPFTGGDEEALDNNADNSIPQGTETLEGVIIENPTVTGAPLDIANASTAALAHRFVNSFTPLIIPAGFHVVIMVDNSNKGNEIARMYIELWFREEGR